MPPAQGASHLPDDFGLGPIATLSRVGDPTPAIDHAPSWTRWLKAVHAEPVPTLAMREPGAGGLGEVDPSDPTATHALLSLGGVRIGARLVMPPRGTAVSGVLVAGHGYAPTKPLAERDGLFPGCLARGVAVLHIRLRGYAGSRLDTGDLTRGPGPGLGWVCHGLDADDDTPDAFRAWVYPRAVADVFNACRAARRWLNRAASANAPLFLHGESLSGGLAVAAAALLAGRPETITAVERMALALPSMGDWPWRLGGHTPQAHSGRGMGGEIARLIAARPDVAQLIAGRLRVADSVILAARVRCAVLCKLAHRDEVVPAPTAAAVFNALGVDPGRKWRFIVPHGHAETGLANTRRHAEFERAIGDFLDPARAPEAAMADWEPRLNPSLQEPQDQPPRPAGLFQQAQAREDPDTRLIAAYEAEGRTLDDLPYTDSFGRIHDSVHLALGTDERGTLHRLYNLRKAGRLPRLGRAASPPLRINPEEEDVLTELLAEAIGRLGGRDRLPYTPTFDTVAERFTAATGRQLSPHDLWRLIAKVAK